MKKKTILLLSAVIFIAGNTAAQIEVSPVNETIIDQVNGSLMGDTFPFPVNQSGENLTVQPGLNFPPQTYTGSVSLNQSVNVSVNQTNFTVVQKNYDLQIPEYSAWKIEPRVVNRTVDVGSQGDLQRFNLSMKSNIRTLTLDVDVKGNLSQYVSAPKTVQVFKTFNTSFSIGYGIPGDTAFGNYTGTLTVDNTTIPLNLVFEDNIKPEIRDSSFPDIMSTTEDELSLEVRDNLEVANVDGRVYRTVTEERQIGNETTTVQVNRTFKNFSFQKQENTDTWSYTFSDTGDIGDYWIDVRVNDTSGNSVNLTDSFRVKGLHAVNVLESDFRFSEMRPRTDDNPDRQVEKQFLELDIESPVTLRLKSFDYRKTNSSVTVGVLHESSSNPEEFDGVNDTIEVRETGRYSLIVYGDSAGQTYQGEIKLVPVPQHAPIQDSIRFSGTIVDPEYPPLPENRSLGSFTGGLEFKTNNNGVPTALVYRGVQYDISNCKGADSWSNCIPGFTLGEIQEVKQKYKRFKFERDITVSAAALLVFVAFWKLLALRKPNTVVAGMGPKQSYFNKHFTKEEYEEVTT